MSNKWFPEIVNESTAKSLSKQGAYGVLIFIAMTLLGAAFVYFAGKSAVDGSSATPEDVLNQIIGTAILIPVQLVMAWRIYQGKGWLVSIVVLLWVIAGITLKIVGGTTNIGWLICYAAIATMMINGLRGCWHIRHIKRMKHKALNIAMLRMPFCCAFAFAVLIMCNTKAQQKRHRKSQR
ncbi:MAG: hypothetical protein IPK77_16900 [Cellvibrio sp.]|nr:hypothetical protein [Cellvibrio sp.]